MFSFLKKSPPSEITTADAIHKIPYSRTFISELLDDHKHLLILFNDIKASSSKGDFSRTSQILRKFTRLLRGHLLKENLKLYIYLQQSFAKDSESVEIIKEYKQEMQSIGKEINKFVTKYSHKNLNAIEQLTFTQELEYIGKILFDRLENEETYLYPLYAEPQHYS